MPELQQLTVNTEHYPILIKSWKVSVGDAVEKNQVLGIYEYLTDEDVSTRCEIKATYAGTIEELGEIEAIFTDDDPICAIRESCSHDVQYQGICAQCGKDLTIGHYTGTDVKRATINLTHDDRGVKLSRNEAARIEKMNTDRLISHKKLSLLLDLDQTVVHATTDHTITEWLVDQPAIQEQIHSFTLGGSDMVYYVKLRPGTKEFLEAVSDKFELHIYTMGTRNYAHAIANAIDPDKKYFSDRILSRDDSGNNFFIGTGDINEPMKENPVDPIPTAEPEGESKSDEFKAPAPRSPKKQQRPQIIEDDNDLSYISTILNQLHKRYYEQYTEYKPIPNVGVILPNLRKSVLEGVHIVFSGVIPLAQDVRTHELWIQAYQFGATCHHELNTQVTHVLAKKTGTNKVNQAKNMDIWIVTPEWLIDSIMQWQKLNEEDYILDPSFMKVTEPILLDEEWDTMNQEVQDALGPDFDLDDDDSENQDEEEENLNDEDDDWLESEINATLNSNKRKFDDADI
ncbi:Carboxy-terminal domain (CTD) phosphatase [Boothiomyces sp. JEL0866]|nr:Carboxy-terminal domain (CTD) phosphatase [Boothiomyces sp. JEL0866]